MKQSIYTNQDNLDYVWRLAIGFGAIPGCVALYFRLTIPETPRYTMDIDNDIHRGANDINKIAGNEHVKMYEKKQDAEKKATFGQFLRHFSKWHNLKVLLGTSITW